MINITELSKLKGRVQLKLGGNDPQPGFVVMSSELHPAVDITHDLESYPYPIQDNTVDMVVAPGVVEHINPVQKGFIKFMDEIWRILKINGQFLISTPYAGSIGYYQDPCNVNPCNEATWYYFDPMQANGILYQTYKPKPWKMIKIAWTPNSQMEVLLEKRPIDPLT